MCFMENNLKLNIKQILTACWSWSCQQDTSTSTIKRQASKSSIVKQSNAKLPHKIKHEKREPQIINEMRSDDLWPGQILRHLIIKETDDYQKEKKNVNSSLHTNSMHFCLT